MYFGIVLGLFLSSALLCTGSLSAELIKASSENLFHQISDDNWKDIQEGQWLIGIFHEDSPQSASLEKDWNVFALKCKELNIKVGMIKAHENPELQVRFLAKEFPKVFHIDDGTVRVFPTATRDELVRIIKEERWNELEHVGKLTDPFSTHLSLFSYLCSRALLLYNYEKKIIFKYYPSHNVVNTAFGVTFVVFGTALGLIFSCLFQVLKFMVSCCLRGNDSEYPSEDSEHEDSSRGNPTSTSQEKRHKTHRKHHVMKARMKLKKKKA